MVEPPGPSSTQADRVAWILATRPDLIGGSLRAWSRKAGLSDNAIGTMLSNARRGPSRLSRDSCERAARVAGLSALWLDSGEGSPCDELAQAVRSGDLAAEHEIQLRGILVAELLRLTGALLAKRAVPVATLSRSVDFLRRELRELGDDPGPLPRHDPR